jgi:hypothetical protein
MDRARNAVETGNLEELKKMVENGLNIDSTMSSSRTLLHEACFHRHFNIVMYLIGIGANIEAKDVMGWTPLRYTCAHGDLRIIKYLVDNGARIDSESTRKWTSLHSVAGLSHFTYFVEAGANLEARTSDNLTPLHVACVYGQDYRAVDFLIRSGAEIEAVDGHGHTSLYLSCANGQYDIVETLISHDCEVLQLKVHEYWSPRIKKRVIESQERAREIHECLKLIITKSRILRMMLTTLSVEICFYIITSWSVGLKSSELKLLSNVLLDRRSLGKIIDTVKIEAGYKWDLLGLFKPKEKIITKFSKKVILNSCKKYQLNLKKTLTN